MKMKEDLLQIVKVLEEFELLEKHLSCFGSLSQSTNTANAKAAIDKVATIASTASKAMAVFSRYGYEGFKQLFKLSRTL